MSYTVKVSSKISQKLSNTKTIQEKLDGFSKNGNKGACGLFNVNQSYSIQMVKSPPILKAQLGLENYFMETKGSIVTVVAATKKLLEEEHLRFSSKGLHVPLSQIVKKCYPSKRSPSTNMIMEDF